MDFREIRMPPTCLLCPDGWRITESDVVARDQSVCTQLRFKQRKFLHLEVERMVAVMDEEDHCMIEVGQHGQRVAHSQADLGAI